MESLGSISPEMLNYDALRDVFEDLAAPLLIDITNFTKLLLFTKQAYQMGLPYTKIWASLINFVLLMHQEVPDELLIEMCWHITKAVGVRDRFTFDTELVHGSSSSRAEKLRKRAQVKFLLSHLAGVKLSKAADILKLLSLD